MYADRIFLIENEAALGRIIRDSASRLCLVGDCGRFERFDPPSTCLIYDLAVKKKHSKKCLGTLEGDKLRKLELALLEKSADCQGIVLTDIESLYKKDPLEIIGLFFLLAARLRLRHTMFYVMVDKEMEREFLLVADKILR